MAFLDEFFDPETTPQHALKLLKDYYTLLSANLGYTVIPPENNVIIWHLSEYKKQKEKAYVIAEYNLACRPNSKDAGEWVDKIKGELGK